MFLHALCGVRLQWYSMSCAEDAHCWVVHLRAADAPRCPMLFTAAFGRLRFAPLLRSTCGCTRLCQLSICVVYPPRYTINCLTNSTNSPARDRRQAGDQASTVSARFSWRAAISVCPCSFFTAECQGFDFWILLTRSDHTLDSTPHAQLSSVGTVNVGSALLLVVGTLALPTHLLVFPGLLERKKTPPLLPTMGATCSRLFQMLQQLFHLHGATKVLQCCCLPITKFFLPIVSGLDQWSPRLAIAPVLSRGNLLGVQAIYTVDVSTAS